MKKDVPPLSHYVVFLRVCVYIFNFKVKSVQTPVVKIHAEREKEEGNRPSKLTRSRVINIVYAYSAVKGGSFNYLTNYARFAKFQRRKEGRGQYNVQSTHIRPGVNCHYVLTRKPPRHYGTRRLRQCRASAFFPNLLIVNRTP